MSITVKKISLTEQVDAKRDQPASPNALDLIGAVEVECYVRLGTLTLTVEQLRQLKQGQVLTLDQKTNETIDIIINNQVIARGELMSCEEHFAIQITEVCS